MTWTVIDLDKLKPVKGWDPANADRAANQKWLTFLNEITENHRHPAEAAEIARTLYKSLGNDQYEIYLSASKRATFLVDKDNETVKPLQIGGHT